MEMDLELNHKSEPTITESYRGGPAAVSSAGGSDRSSEPSRPRVIPVASGKGGVGKSLLSANLGAALSAMGYRVILVDLDLGGSNLHSLVGVENTHMGIAGYSHKGAASLNDLLVDTPIEGVKLVSGDALIPGAANIPWWFKKKLLSELKDLAADFVLIDLGAGSAYNTVDFFLSSREGLVVSNPEPTSMVNGYSFLKNAFFRLLFRLYPSRSAERDLIRRWAYLNRENGEGSSVGILGALEREFPGQGKKAESLIEAMKFGIIMNDFRDDDEAKAWKNLVSACSKNLGFSLEHLGSLPHDPDVRKSAFSRIPVFLSEPNSRYSQSVADLAVTLAERG